MKHDTIIGFLFAIMLALALTLGYFIINKPVQSNPVDPLAKSAHTELAKIHDTIRIYDTIKLKAETKYIKTHDTLWKMAPSSVDSLFNKVYVRDSLDSTHYGTGFTQLRKAIDMNSKFERDSIQKIALEQQIKTCTTGVVRIVKEIDTLRETIKIEEPRNWTLEVLIGALLLFGGVVTGAKL